MDIRRKNSWRLWFASALFALLVLYVASFGPACRCIESDSAAEWFAAIYDPLAWLTKSIEWEWPSDVLVWYGGQTAEMYLKPRVYVSGVGGNLIVIGTDEDGKMIAVPIDEVQRRGGSPGKQ